MGMGMEEGKAVAVMGMGWAVGVMEEGKAVAVMGMEEERVERDTPAPNWCQFC